MRVELLQDTKGVYGIGIENIPGGYQLRPIVTRPDRVSDEGVALDTALQMIPRKWFARSAEYQYIQTLREAWAVDPCERLMVHRLPRNYHFALLTRCRRTVNSRLRQALAVADPRYLRTARRYPIRLRFSIYRACCVHGERVDQIANTFPLAAVFAYVDSTYWNREHSEAARLRQSSAEIRELVQNGARLRVIADALKVPKQARAVWPGNVLLTPWKCFQLNPECLNYMPSNIHKQRLWLSALGIASETESATEFQVWVARHAFELPKLPHLRIAKLRDWLDWIRASNDKINAAELEKLRIDLRELEKKACGFGKPIQCVSSRLQPHPGAAFITRLFNRNMSVSTIEQLSEDWHEAVSLADYSGPDIKFPEPWYEGGEIGGYTITPIRTPAELYAHGRAMHNCSMTYAERIIAGACFFYCIAKAKKPVGTLMISDRQGTTVFDELRAACNEYPDPHLSAAVYEWWDRSKQLHGNGNKPERREVKSPVRQAMRQNEDDEMAFFQRILNGQ